METKKERFTRISRDRTDKIKNQIRSIENFKNKSFYECKDEDVLSLIDEIQESLNDVRNRFLGIPKFSLDHREE